MAGAHLYRAGLGIGGVDVVAVDTSAAGAGGVS